MCLYAGLSVNSVTLVEGTLFFIFSFHPSFIFYYLFYICFLSSPSSSSSFPILSPLSSINSSVLSYSFLDFTFSSSLFILFFSLYLLLIPIGFLHFFSLFFILTLLFLSLYFSFLRGFCNFLHIPSPWWTTNSVDKLS